MFPIPLTDILSAGCYFEISVTQQQHTSFLLHYNLSIFFFRKRRKYTHRAAVSIALSDVFLHHRPELSMCADGLKQRRQAVGRVSTSKPTRLKSRLLSCCFCPVKDERVKGKSKKKKTEDRLLTKINKHLGLRRRQ